MNTNLIELNDLYDYDYKIYQNSDHFKFSLDSVLLAEFVDLKSGQKEILDLCSGNAPIPMILSKKFGDRIHITGVEIQESIFDLGIKSIEYNKIENIDFINEDVNNLPQVLKNKRFNIITCNPPYFKVNETNYINENEIKAIARHEIKITIDDIVKVSSKLLETQGYLYLVHRTERLADIIKSLSDYNFGVKRIVPIYSKTDTNANLFLIEAIYNGKDYVTIDSPVYLDRLTTYKDLFRK